MNFICINNTVKDSRKKEIFRLEDPVFCNFTKINDKELEIIKLDAKNSVFGTVVGEISRERERERERVTPMS